MSISPDCEILHVQRGWCWPTGSRTFILKMPFPSLQLILTDSSRPFPCPIMEWLVELRGVLLPLLFKPRDGTKGALNLRAKLIAKALSPRPTGTRTWMEFLLQNVTITSVHFSLLFQGSNWFSLEELLMWLQSKEKNSGDYLPHWYPVACSSHTIDTLWIIFHPNNSFIIFSM